MIQSITPDWPAPPSIHALTTTRKGGVSQGNFASFNLASHVLDDPNAIIQNRRRLRTYFNLPSEPLWLNQQHSDIILTEASYSPNTIADGLYTHHSHILCTVLTADCLPILLCNQNGTEVAALHGGWRGLTNEIIEKGIACFESPSFTLLAWLGPAIGPEQFEIGNEVRELFIRHDPRSTTAFQPLKQREKWLANLYELARQRLIQCGVKQIYGGNYCTYTNDNLFYSYRRHHPTGRMATLIWIE